MNRFARLFSLALVGWCWSEADAVASILAQFDIAGVPVSASSLAPSVQGANVAVSSLALAVGSGLTPNAGANPNLLYAEDWASSLDTAQFYEFTVTPTSGFQMTLTTLEFAWGLNSLSLTSSFRLRSSQDGFTADLASLNGLLPGSTNPVTANVSSLGSISSRSHFGFTPSAARGRGQPPKPASTGQPWPGADTSS